MFNWIMESFRLVWDSLGPGGISAVLVLMIVGVAGVDHVMNIWPKKHVAIVPPEPTPRACSEDQEAAMTEDARLAIEAAERILPAARNGRDDQVIE